MPPVMKPFSTTKLPLLSDRRPPLPAILIPGPPNLYHLLAPPKGDHSPISPSASLGRDEPSPRPYPAFNDYQLPCPLGSHPPSPVADVPRFGHVRTALPVVETFRVQDARWRGEDVEVAAMGVGRKSRYARHCPPRIVIICGAMIGVGVGVLVAAVVLSMVGTK